MKELNLSEIEMISGGHHSAGGSLGPALDTLHNAIDGVIHSVMHDVGQAIQDAPAAAGDIKPYLLPAPGGLATSSSCSGSWQPWGHNGPTISWSHTSF